MSSYVIHLNESEARTITSLAWRYDAAHILWQHMCLDEDVAPDANGSYPHGPATITIPECDAWEYMRALDEDGQIVPTCVGGPLADKLIAFYDAIV